MGGSTTSSGAMGRQEVYGQVNEISGDEIEIEPAYGEPVKLKLESSAQAAASDLKEGEEVRASFEERGGDNVAVELKTGADAEPMMELRAPSSSGSDMGTGTTGGSTRPSTTGGPAGNETGSSTGSTKSETSTGSGRGY